MLLARGICAVTLMVLSASAAYAASRPERESQSSAEMAARSRDAGLLTDWHLIGRYGRGPADFARTFEPERQAGDEAAKAEASRASAMASDELPGRRRMPSLRYEMLFADGTFALPKRLAADKGVFYAVSCTYLSDDGEWNVYLESSGQAEVFVDGRRVLKSDASPTGAQRETIRSARGYHTVLVKFLAQAAPFRVAILPPNSGSRRKNNTPHFGGTENMNAMLLRPNLPPSALF